MSIRQSLLKSMSQKDLEEKTAAMLRKHHGFLSRMAAERLVAIDMKVPISLIDAGGLKSGISFRARVERVWQAASYPSGARSRAIWISDDTCEGVLVLWNSHADISRYLRRGDMVGAREVFRRNGEFHLPQKGELSLLERAGITEIKELESHEGKTIHARGKIISLDGWVSISDGSGSAECEIPKAGFMPGDEIMLESAIVRRGRLIVPKEGRILIKRNKVCNHL
jgi:hypothetical protein